jgi:hypothetical protein
VEARFVLSRPTAPASPPTPLVGVEAGFVFSGRGVRPRSLLVTDLASTPLVGVGAACGDALATRLLESLDAHPREKQVAGGIIGNQFGQ